MTTIEAPKIVSHDEWLAARRKHLVREKEITRLRDQLAAERRALPWEKVEKAYVFDGPQGRETLGDLFAGRRQLIVYHFMFGPDWEEGCPGCSFLCDHLDGANLHLAHHDVMLLAVSRAPWPKLEAYRKRMGWKFKWVSSSGSDFNYDYHVSSTPEEVKKGEGFYNYTQTEIDGEEHPGISVFYQDEGGAIFHTYSAYARGGDILIGALNFLDLTPKGRNETTTMDWVRRHDQYEDAETIACCGGGKRA